MKATLTQEVYLGRHIPDRADLAQCTYCAVGSHLGLVTIPFPVYGEEHAKRIKPGFFVDADGGVARRVLAGLGPEATVFAYDERGIYLAWADPNRTTVVAVNRAGRGLWRHSLRGYGCARRDAMGLVAVGSVAGELRRLDRTGTLLHDFDPIFGARPFSGPHGVDLVGSLTYIADPDATHSVWAIDNMGNATRRLGTDDPAENRSGRGLLCYPFDVAVLEGDVVWVAEHGRHRLAALDLSGSTVDVVTAADVDADEICTQRLFTDWERRSINLFARRHREIFLLTVTP